MWHGVHDGLIGAVHDGALRRARAAAEATDADARPVGVQLTQPLRDGPSVVAIHIAHVANPLLDARTPADGGGREDRRLGLDREDAADACVGTAPTMGEV